MIQENNRFNIQGRASGALPASGAEARRLVQVFENLRFVRRGMFLNNLDELVALQTEAQHHNANLRC